MDNITQQYVQELAEIKAMLRMSDRDLAKQIGVTPAMLSNWRTGKAGISARCQNRIIQFYLQIDWKKVEKENPELFPAVHTAPNQGAGCWNTSPQNGRALRPLNVPKLWRSLSEPKQEDNQTIDGSIKAVMESDLDPAAKVKIYNIITQNR